MKPEELAAYIGAAAWVPQILTWVYRAIKKPKLRIVPDEKAEVGFTSLGPIFNLRMVFFVENRDLIVDDITLVIKHSDGDEHEMRWTGLNETFSEITDAQGNRQTISKDQTPIAIKVPTESLLEKFVRFQEPCFHREDSQILRELITHSNFLKQKAPDTFVQQTLDGKEFSAVVERRQRWFWWKPGHYVITVKVRSPQMFNQVESSFTVNLTALDVDNLRKNISSIELDLKNAINSNLPDSKPQRFDWQWAYVLVQQNA